MKKYLYYFFAVVCSVCLFSCSDDDDPDPEPTPSGLIDWKDCKGIYGASENALKLGSDVITDGTKTVELAVGTNNNAKFILKNIIEDDEIEEITVDDVTMTAGETAYTFTKTATLEEGTISISGTLIPGIMTKDTGPVYATLDFQCTFKSVDPEEPTPTELAGTWKLGMSETGADFSLDITSTSFGLNALGFFVNNAVPGLIATKVSDVTLNFNDGIFTFNWTKQGETASTDIFDVILGMGMPAENIEMAKQLLVFNYNEVPGENILNISISNTAMQTVEGMLGNIPQAAGYIGLIKSVMAQEGNNYILPILYDLDGSSVKFYMNKEMLTGIITVLVQSGILESLLGGIEIPGIDIEEILEAIPTAQQFDVSLGFVK